MILIADSGSTKTDWAGFSLDKKEYAAFRSQGYNPNYISADKIAEDILANLPESIDRFAVEEIYFYGAGVTPMQYPFMQACLQSVFVNAKTIQIAMDTLASCRALLGSEPGFAAILGTGANTCLYDGLNETLNVDSCGFILGDEGSGGYLGKRLITDYIRHSMPEKVYDLLTEALGMSNEELIDTIYTKPYPNRFCAQYAKFIREHIEFDPYFQNLVNDAFHKFFDRIVTHYPAYQSYTFNAVGSVAYHFWKYLEPVVKEYGMAPGRILQAPMEGLIEYHSKVR